MSKITVYTKQNEVVLDQLERDGRFIAKKEFITQDLQEHTDLVLETYDWLAGHTTNLSDKPADVSYPIWVTFSQSTTMLPDKGFVILELIVEEEMIAYINVAKWGHILNYGYIPADAEDDQRHKKMLEAYGVSDAKAFMSQFYPEIKKEIKDSWVRLFDPDIQLGSEYAYGNIWEVRKEWISKTIK